MYGSEKMSGSIKNFWLYLTGRIVSLVGSGIQSMAIPLYVLDTTGSGTMMGIFVMVSVIPLLIFSPFAGVLGDRWNRKKIMVWTDIVRGLVILMLAGLSFGGTMNITALFIAQAAVSVMNSLFSSSTMAMLPELVDKDFLPRANSLVSATQSVSLLIGPVLGGVMYGVWGIKAIFLINGISFIASAISEWFIKYRYINERKEKLSIKSTFSDIKEVMRFVYENKALKFLILFSLTMNFFFNAGFAVIKPYFYRETIGFSAQQFGFIDAFFTIGVLAGNLIFGLFFSKKDLIKMTKKGLFFAGGVYIIMGVTSFPFFSNVFDAPNTPYFLLMGILELALGVAVAFIDTPLISLLQSILPKKFIARFFSIITIASQFAMPLGGFVYGLILDRAPSYILYLIVSVLAFVIVAGGFAKAPKEFYEMHKIADKYGKPNVPAIDADLTSKPMDMENAEV